MQRHHIVIQVFVDDLVHGLAIEWLAPRECLVEYAAEGIQVGVHARRFAGELLGRHVVDGAHDAAFMVLRLLPCGDACAGQAEVDDLRLQASASQALDFDVLRFDVPMQDAQIVGGQQGFQRLLGQLLEVIEHQRPVSDGVGEVRPFEQFHHHEQTFAVLRYIEDGDDICVTQRCQCVRFAPEFLRIRIGAGGFLRAEQALDGDPSFQLRIERAEYGAIASGAKLFVDGVSLFRHREGRCWSDRATLAGRGGRCQASFSRQAVRTPDCLDDLARSQERHQFLHAEIGEDLPVPIERRSFALP